MRPLIIGIALIPLCFWIYVSNNGINERCHVPATGDGYLFYEVVPWFALTLLCFAVGVFGYRALCVSDHELENALATVLTLCAGIFGFALVYHTYGIQEDTGLFIPVPPQYHGVVSLTVEGRQDSGVIVDIERSITDTVIDPSVADRPENERVYPTAAVPFVMLEKDFAMVDSAWDYLLFSIATAVPGARSDSYVACPSASPIVLLQNIFGLVMTIILSLLGAKIQNRFTRKDPEAP